MMRRTLFTLIISSMLSGPVFAQITSTPGETTSTTTTTCETAINCLVSGTPTPTAEDTPTDGGTGLVSTDTTSPTGNSGNYSDAGEVGTGTYEQAAGAESQSMMTQMMGMMIAATNLPQCGRPGGQASCALGMAGLGLAALGAAGASSAQGVQEEIGVDGSTPGGTGTTQNPDTAVTTAELDKLKGDYAKMGYKTDAAGNTVLPNGKGINSGMSKKELMSAGMSAASANQYMNGIKDIQNKLDQKLKDMQIAGGGGAGGATAGDGSGSMQGAVGSGAGETTDHSVSISNEDANRDPAAWNGFSKQFGDSNIGVAQADIFGLVINRVEKERKAMGH